MEEKTNLNKRELIKLIGYLEYNLSLIEKEELNDLNVIELELLKGLIEKLNKMYLEV